MKVSKVLFVTVEGSIRSPRMKLSKVAVSSDGGIERPRTDLLNVVPSFSYAKIRIKVVTVGGFGTYIRARKDRNM